MADILVFFQNHPVLVLAFVAVNVALIVTLVRGGTGGGAPKVGPLEATRLINHDDGVVVDVRNDGEFRNGHIVNAINLAAKFIPDQGDKLEKHRQRPVILVCANGQQSARAGAALRKQGFEKIYIMAGGIGAWEGANLPLTRK